MTNEIDLTKNGSVRKAGQFKAGQSGNPGGRPKDAVTITELARAHTEDAIAVLAEIATNPKANPSARVNAASALLDRGWGKPAVYIETNSTILNFSDYARICSEREVRFQAILAENNRDKALAPEKQSLWDELIHGRPEHSAPLVSVTDCEIINDQGDQ